MVDMINSTEETLQLEKTKGLLSWYVITVKLNQAVGLQNAQTPSNSRSINFLDTSNSRRQENLPLNPLNISIKEQETSVVESGQNKHPKPEWVIDIKVKLKQAQHDGAAGLWAKQTIYRIPQYLRENDEKAYIPQTVSLGPYHHDEKRLHNMDRHKWRALNHVLKRSNQQIELYLDAVKELEDKARACYEGQICLSNNKFVEMMVLDSCFVLELFRGAACGFTKLGYSRNDPIFMMRGTLHSIRQDMIMLENQIPLFILEKLYGVQSGYPDNKSEVARLALRFFDPLMPTNEHLTNSDRNKLNSSPRNLNSTFDPLTEQGGLHCLEVFRRNLLRTRSGPKPALLRRDRGSEIIRVADERRQQLIHCVTELKNAGIKFKRRETDRFWDITFEKGTLEIPRLLINDGTKSLFLNLMAFEQCHMYRENDITTFVIFMDNLINSPADVSYLHYCGIIENWLGSDAEVADLFNQLCQEVAFDINDSSLSRLSKQVNEYHVNKWNTWKATLKHKYFNNPWSIISLIAAIVLLVLTLAQTFYTVYGYYMPRPRS